MTPRELRLYRAMAETFGLLTPHPRQRWREQVRLVVWQHPWRFTDFMVRRWVRAYDSPSP